MLHYFSYLLRWPVVIRVISFYWTEIPKSISSCNTFDLGCSLKNNFRSQPSNKKVFFKLFFIFLNRQPTAKVTLYLSISTIKSYCYAILSHQLHKISMPLLPSSLQVKKKKIMLWLLFYYYCVERESRKLVYKGDSFVGILCYNCHNPIFTHEIFSGVGTQNEVTRIKLSSTRERSSSTWGLSNIAESAFLKV